MDNLTRRGFLVGCSAAIAGLAGARLNYAAFGDPAEEPNQNILVTIFLRGGCDALSVITPLAGDDRGHYELARPDIKLPTAGPNSLLPLNGQFGLHHAAAPLNALYQDGKLALVVAAGMHEDTRSHFDAMDYMEMGTPGYKGHGSGWLTRLLRTAEIDESAIIPSVAVGRLQPVAQLGHYETISMTAPADINLNIGYWGWRAEQQATLRSIFQQENSSLHRASQRALDTATVLTEQNVGAYTPTVNTYPTGAFGDQLKTIAQLIKLQLGLKVATIDLGGWDTHENQINWGAPTAGYFTDLLGRLAQGMAALYADLEASGSHYTQRLTVVVMTEFGRRLKENAQRGTDHGHGSFMMVLGGQVNGGLHGVWPGLHNDQLYDRADLAVTTDYRRVLSEIMIRRLGNNKLGYVFPGYVGYQPLGVVQGEDLEPNYEGGIYRAYMPLVTR